ncbi:MAG: Rpn family recombination-promoting nuclease/putative transposase [Lachnospiraceae bacterium]|nr:Rpn family recombination-promoting nuclease/putative transposase [Lachnospiraceae bacterium]
MKKDYENTMPYDDGWKKKTGPLGFRMCNDYLFRAFLQRDEESLKALIASFLQITPEAVGDVTVTNPIILGEEISDKELHLDVRVVTENGRLFNLEMQLAKHKGWIERSVLYACRCYDSAGHGDHYNEIPGVWQISFCDFCLFDEYPFFYSSYMLINTKNINVVYSDKLRVSNVNLTNIDMATEEDIRFGIKKWAQVFKAQTWEELIMLAEKDKTVDRAVSSAWQLTEDERVYEQIRRREENERLWNATIRDLEEAKKETEETNRKMEEQKVFYEQQLKEKDAIIAELMKKLS